MASPRLLHYEWSDVFSDDSDLSIVHSTRSGRRLRHDHGYFENVFVLSGSGRLISTSLNAPLRAGTVIFIPPLTWHEYADCVDLALVFCSLKSSLMASDFAFVREHPPWGSVHGGIRILRLAPAAARRLKNLLRPASALLAKADRFEKLGHYLRILGQVRSAADDQWGPDRGQRLHPLTRRVLELIQQDPSEHLTLTAMARQLHGVHPVYLGRVFRRDVGLSPMAYLTRLRCSQAAALLRTTEDPVSEIAARCGWPDANLFSRRFRQIFHQTPSAYRATHFAGEK